MRPNPDAQQKANPRHRTRIHNPHIPPRHLIPPRNVVIHLRPQAPHAPQMAQVRQQQPHQQASPDAQIDDAPLHAEHDIQRCGVRVLLRGHAQDDDFVDGEEEVEIRELLHDDGDGWGEAVGQEGEGPIRGGEVQVGGRVEVGVVGACEGCDGLEREEEEAVDAWDDCSVGHDEVTARFLRR